MLTPWTAQIASCEPAGSVDKIEAKYYADGEDAYAMRKDLPKSPVIIEEETKSRLAGLKPGAAVPAERTEEEGEKTETEQSDATTAAADGEERQLQ